jgi:hypothetical protein
LTVTGALEYTNGINARGIVICVSFAGNQMTNSAKMECERRGGLDGGAYRQRHSAPSRQHAYRSKVYFDVYQRQSIHDKAPAVTAA